MLLLLLLLLAVDAIPSSLYGQFTHKPAHAQTRAHTHTNTHELSQNCAELNYISILTHAPDVTCAAVLHDPHAAVARKGMARVPIRTNRKQGSNRRWTSNEHNKKTQKCYIAFTLHTIMHRFHHSDTHTHAAAVREMRKALCSFLTLLIH